MTYNLTTQIAPAADWGAVMVWGNGSIELIPLLVWALQPYEDDKGEPSSRIVGIVIDDNMPWEADQVILADVVLPTGKRRRLRAFLGYERAATFKPDDWREAADRVLEDLPEDRRPPS